MNQAITELKTKIGITSVLICPVEAIRERFKETSIGNDFALFNIHGNDILVIDHSALSDDDINIIYLTAYDHNIEIVLDITFIDIAADTNVIVSALGQVCLSVGLVCCETYLKFPKSQIRRIPNGFIHSFLNYVPDEVSNNSGEYINTVFVFTMNDIHHDDVNMVHQEMVDSYNVRYENLCQLANPNASFQPHVEMVKLPLFAIDDVIIIYNACVGSRR